MWTRSKRAKDLRAHRHPERHREPRRGRIAICTCPSMRSDPVSECSTPCCRTAARTMARSTRQSGGPAGTRRRIQPRCYESERRLSSGARRAPPASSSPSDREYHHPRQPRINVARREPGDRAPDTGGATCDRHDDRKLSLQWRETNAARGPHDPQQAFRLQTARNSREYRRGVCRPAKEGALFHATRCTSARTVRQSQLTLDARLEEAHLSGNDQRKSKTVDGLWRGIGSGSSDEIFRFRDRNPETRQVFKGKITMPA